MIKKKMKILWLCNIMLPIIGKYLGKEFSAMGGWLTGLSNDLMLQENIELVVVFPNKNEKITGKVANLKYYGFSTNNNYEEFTQILKDENPDIIHIFGTEYSHTLDMVNVCEKLNVLNKVVVNIQGLVSFYGKYHYNSDLPNKILNQYTFRDFLRHDNIKQQGNKFIERGKLEVSALEKVKHIIGRTDWDKACTSQINPNANYYFCNETLRDEFYKHNWDIEKCEKHSIFLSQVSYPIKGFHYVLEAMPEILKTFPNAKIYTTGLDVLNLKGINKIKENSYQKYIAKLIKKYNLQDKIVFLGQLNEKQMCERYLKSHVFVSPSSIENSPNSVGESMLLGVPTVVSDVGGVKNMIEHNKQGYVYQHNAPYMLAYYVSQIFNSDEIALNFSKQSKIKAECTHNKEINAMRIMKIYSDINSFNQ